VSLELRISGISKSYHGVQVLKDCSYAFDNGGVYCLMGPNGSGKSTLLRICSLLEEPDSGDVNFYSDSVPANKDIQLKRRITLLLPRVGIFNTTVFKNVAYGLAVRRFETDQIETRALQALEFVGLAGKRNQKALTLSSGETQRLGIARALVIEPEIFFLDEPTASVDHKNTEIIEEIIERLKQKGRSTILIATHDGAQAERLSDKLLFIKDGRLIEDSVRTRIPIESHGRQA
jgi:tungstate transport system ATP-binding protein